MTGVARRQGGGKRARLKNKRRAGTAAAASVRSESGAASAPATRGAGKTHPVERGTAGGQQGAPVERELADRALLLADHQAEAAARAAATYLDAVGQLRRVEWTERDDGTGGLLDMARRRRGKVELDAGHLMPCLRPAGPLLQAEAEGQVRLGGAVRRARQTAGDRQFQLARISGTQAAPQAAPPGRVELAHSDTANLERAVQAQVVRVIHTDTRGRVPRIHPALCGSAPVEAEQTRVHWPVHVLDFGERRVGRPVGKDEPVDAELSVVPLAVKVAAVRPKVSTGHRVSLVQALVGPVPDEAALCVRESSEKVPPLGVVAGRVAHCVRKLTQHERPRLGTPTIREPSGRPEVGDDVLPLDRRSDCSDQGDVRVHGADNVSAIGAAARLILHGARRVVRPTPGRHRVVGGAVAGLVAE
eukprot:scaffold4194_cov131-Isochrysis_galbana.AAC.11